MPSAAKSEGRRPNNALTRPNIPKQKKNAATIAAGK
jgi:hypothetical protein